MSQAPAINPPRSTSKPGRPAAEFRVLGSLAASIAGKPVALGGPKQRLVLALLILDANRVVSADRLIDKLWGDEPPEAARGTLQAYVSRLRKTLGPGRIDAQTPGYVLRATHDEVDSDRFERLVGDAQSRLDSDPQAARSLLDLALDLWRGPAFDDLATEHAVRAEVSRLEELRLTAVGYRIEARMALGQHAEVVPELERLVAEHPLREPFSASLMLALYRSGRQAQALEAFERIRHLVSDELGVDPSPGLRLLHERILKQDSDLVPKGRRLRGYELMERLGEGANGIVYRAVQPTVRRDVAVKVMHRALANQPEFIRRFEQEAQLVARLEHPHIVPLHDYWREPEGAYLAMRYLRGGSLKDRLETKGPLTAREAVRLVDQVCSALAFAHRQNIVHRDVRPANVLFDEEGNAYLSDFGIAIESVIAGALSRRYGAFAFYLAPEEIQSKPISAATDVYGLGLLIYEALVGRHAFADSPSAEILDRQLSAPTPPLALIRPDLPPAVGAVLRRATEKDPAARYQDAASLAIDFREAFASDSTEPAVAPAIDRNPYKGLRAFDEADASDFFGREELTAQLVARLKEAGRGSRLLVVVGPSGSGKSSAVCAGLLPAIRRGEVPGSEGWFVVEMHPGAHPFQELESALLRVATQHPPSLLEELEWGERGLLQATNRILPADDSELLLVVDQFEELFTLVSDERLRNAFLEALVEAACDPESRVRVVITLRADFYDRPLLHPRFGDIVARRTQAVTPMRSEEVEHAIAGPAETAGAKFEPGLIGAIVSDVADEPGSLPLLQYALTELFDQRAESTLTLEVYRRLGGISGALSRRAEDLFRRLDEGSKDAARQVFLRLVSLGEDGSADSRRRVLRSELAALDVEPRVIDRVIELFGTHRFLTLDRDPATRGQTVEVAHEALLRSWRRLRGWVDSGRDDLRTYRRLSVDASEWDAAARDQSFLQHGSRLEQLENWAKHTHLAMSALEREYLDASLRAREKAQTDEHVRQQREALLNQRALNRLRAGVAVLVVGVLLAGSLALVAQERGARAERVARIATARQLVAAATASLTVNSDRSLLLALQAAETTRRVDGTVLPEAAEALHAAVQADRVLLATPGHRAQFSADGTRLLIVGANAGEAEVREGTGGRLLSRHKIEGGPYPTEGDQPELAFTPDGREFVTSGPSGLALYDAQTGDLLRKLGGICCAEVWITPDGKFVAAAEANPCAGSVGSSTRVFDITDGRESNCFPWAGFWAFSPDGKRAMVATGDFDSAHVGAVFVGSLDDRDGAKFVRLQGQNVVNGAAWSVDGATFATSSTDSVMLWDPRTSTKPLIMLSPPVGESFTSIAWGPQPGLLATGMADGSAIVWNVSRDGAEMVLRLAGHDAGLRSVAFAPDGNRLVTGSSDGLVKVWDITGSGGGESVSVVGSGGLDLSHDGHMIAAGGEDGHLRVYDSATGRQMADLPAHSTRVEVVGFGPDGTTLVSAGSDGTVMSRIGNDSPIWTRKHEEGTAVNVAISPDGTIVAIPAANARISLVQGGTGSEITFVQQPSNTCDSSLVGTALAFTRDGSLLAVGGDCGGCRMIQTHDSALISVLDSGDLTAIAFSPDGRRLVTAATVGEADAVRVYELRGPFGRVLGTLKPNSPVIAVAVSPNGSTIATGETDGTLRLWDATTFKETLVVARDAHGKLAFSPDGTRLVYMARGGFVRVLSLRVDDLIQLAKARLARSQVKN